MYKNIHAIAQDLAYAVIHQAVLDYKDIRRRTDLSLTERMDMIDEIEQFFFAIDRHRWFIALEQKYNKKKDG